MSAAPQKVSVFGVTSARPLRLRCIKPSLTLSESRYRIPRRSDSRLRISIVES